MDVSMKSNTFALQNIKQRIWQAVKILKGYWNFTTKESKTSGISIVSFCQRNGIVYSQFERWYKNRHKVKVHAVDIVDKDGALQVQDSSSESCVIDNQVLEHEDLIQSEVPLFTIQIRSTTGMYFQHKNLDYKSLKDLVGKLEVLC